MRARDARHQFDGEGSDAGSGELLRRFERAKRAVEANDGLVAAKKREIVFAGGIVRPVAENLHDDVGGLENLGA